MYEYHGNSPDLAFYHHSSFLHEKQFHCIFITLPLKTVHFVYFITWSNLLHACNIHVYVHVLIIITKLQKCMYDNLVTLDRADNYSSLYGASIMMHSDKGFIIHFCK